LASNALPFDGDGPCHLVSCLYGFGVGNLPLSFTFQAMSERLFEALTLYLVLSILFKD
jgi:hypothetical protein